MYFHPHVIPTIDDQHLASLRRKAASHRLARVASRPATHRRPVDAEV